MSEGHSGSCGAAARAAACALALLVAAAGLLGSAGCEARSVIRDYPGVEPDRLWDAALAAAEDPLPGPWHVIENGVWDDEAARRIELHRVLKRDVFEPGVSRTYREERDWAVSIRVLDPAAGERRWAPAIQIVDRTRAFPRKFHAFTDDYFQEIERRLIHMPANPAPERPRVPGGLLTPDATVAPPSRAVPPPQPSAAPPAPESPS